MVMTFVFTLLSHYNSITEPRAQSIDFPSHFIISIIDVHRDTMTYDELIFPSGIMRMLCHSFIPILDSLLYTIMGAISAVSIRRSEA